MRRPRRNRRSEPIRNMLREVYVQPYQLIYPLFITQEEEGKIEITSLPKTYRLSRKEMFNKIEEALALGINSFILFPVIPEEFKDKTASYSVDPDNFYLKYCREIKDKYGDRVTLCSDVAMDPYSTDGHDGIYRDGLILNDETLPILSQMAVAQAKAGFDIIGPSDMMDHRVDAIRTALDKEGFEDIGIMAYTAKYASAFYGPFRDALDSAPKSGDKKTYQMDPGNTRESYVEAEMDIMEGADIIMVKPAVHYMDIIKNFRTQYDVPIACYHVSGECAMLIAACQKGWLEYKTAMPETILSLRRAGADIIITYFALEYARYLKGEPLEMIKN